MPLVVFTYLLAVKDRKHMEEFANLARPAPSMVISAVITIPPFYINTWLGLIKIGGRIYIHV